MAIARALDKDVSQRWQTAGAMRAALEQASEPTAAQLETLAEWAADEEWELQADLRPEQLVATAAQRLGTAGRNRSLQAEATAAIQMILASVVSREKDTSCRTRKPMRDQLSWVSSRTCLLPSQSWHLMTYGMTKTSSRLKLRCELA